MTHRPIHTIASEILQDWKRPYFGAVPYLSAMQSLDGIDDTYGYDDARSVILYFMANATTWRGAKAREIKAELKALTARR
jgi:hypothetical protein